MPSKIMYVCYNINGDVIGVADNKKDACEIVLCKYDYRYPSNYINDKIEEFTINEFVYK